MPHFEDITTKEAKPTTIGTQPPRPAVQPWVEQLPMQTQTLLFVSLRGFDGFDRFDSHKDVSRSLRACIVNAAFYGRPMRWEDGYNSFMHKLFITDVAAWNNVIEDMLKRIDAYEVHPLMHMLHAAQVLGVYYPVPDGFPQNEEFVVTEPHEANIRQNWWRFYETLVRKGLNLRPEPPEEMKVRLNDWGQQHWDPVMPADATTKNGSTWASPNPPASYKIKPPLPAGVPDTPEVRNRLDHYVRTGE